MKSKQLRRFLFDSAFRQEYSELKRLRRLPRFHPDSTRLPGSPVKFADAKSFLFMYREIFEQQIYRFNTPELRPVILDCGANIGLSVLYFKKLFPESRITAFEPDPAIFALLEENIRGADCQNVVLKQQAVWKSNTDLEFMADGADGGRVVATDQAKPRQRVAAVRLRDFLDQRVDFLKMDIEGAETDVLLDCADSLQRVSHLFVEYHSFVDRPQTLPAVVDVLANAGFRLHIHPPVTSPQPFHHRDVHLGMDMQLNIFAFRIQS